MYDPNKSMIVGALIKSDNLFSIVASTPVDNIEGIVQTDEGDYLVIMETTAAPIQYAVCLN